MEESLSDISTKKKSSFAEAFLNLLKSFLGTSIIILPYFMEKVGFELGVITCSIVGFLSFYNLTLVMEVANSL